FGQVLRRDRADGAPRITYEPETRIRPNPEAGPDLGLHLGVGAQIPEAHRKRGKDPGRRAKELGGAEQIPPRLRGLIGDLDVRAFPRQVKTANRLGILVQYVVGPSEL